jgi:hypothetical protein
MLALGQPHQERWLDRHLSATGARVGVAVGGFLDFASGGERRAPAWMNRAGLEWTFRLAQEPRRLGRRYLVGNPTFLWRVSRAAAGDSPRASITAEVLGQPAPGVQLLELRPTPTMTLSSSTPSAPISTLSSY